ncbi:HsdR [Klebsiella grimontii]|uniref:HsdR n=2 Tax=Enterobacteriaceae TaxID=543 RepID=A0A285B8C2_9ENTR|nr:HsdR [Klebsiella grimontii]
MTQENRMKIAKPLLKSPSGEVTALIENGMDFLDKAREEFEAEKYKHSVVSFWTAVEILLKVPLASEHWTLVCSGKRISRQNYLAGNFQSVTFDESCARLKEILESPLPKETEALFNTIRSHRNRVVHFFHAAFSDTDVNNILAEQARAWFALNRLMREDWQQHFEAPLGWKLAFNETRLLRGNEFYAEARLKHIHPELEKIRAEGTEFYPCPICKKPACVEKATAVGKHGPVVCVESCKVCFHTTRYVRYICECDTAQILPVEEGDGETFTCPTCNVEFIRYDLLDEEYFRSVDEMADAIDQTECASCDGHETVCVFGEGLLCTRCLEVQPDIISCSCCGKELDELGITNGISLCLDCNEAMVESYGDS